MKYRDFWIPLFSVLTIIASLYCVFTGNVMDGLQWGAITIAVILLDK